MRNIWKKSGFYILLVILPALMISIGVYKSSVDAAHHTYRQDAYLTLFINRQQIDSLINETEAKINSISLALNPPFHDKEVSSLFYGEIQKDPRLAGLNLLDREGNVLYSTLPFDQNSHPRDEIFEVVKETNQSASSDPFYGETTGKHLFSIYHPIIDENGQTAGYLLASMDIDYIKSMINSLNPDIYIRMKNSNNQIILSNGDKTYSDLSISPVETILNNSNWKLGSLSKICKMDNTRQKPFNFLLIYFYCS